VGGERKGGGDQPGWGGGGGGREAAEDAWRRRCGVKAREAKTRGRVGGVVSADGGDGAGLGRLGPGASRGRLAS